MDAVGLIFINLSFETHHIPKDVQMRYVLRYNRRLSKLIFDLLKMVSPPPPLNYYLQISHVVSFIFDAYLG